MIFLTGTRQKYSPMAKITVLPKTEGSPYRLLPLLLNFRCILPEIITNEHGQP